MIRQLQTTLKKLHHKRKEGGRRMEINIETAEENPGGGCYYCGTQPFPNSQHCQDFWLIS